jgi:hypothetical protein
MCERCNEIDAQIHRYKQLARSITDKPAIESIERLIASVEAEKRALHPEQ